MAEAPKTMHVSYDAVKDRLVVTIEGNSCFFNGAAVSQLIDAFGDARSKMQPEYASDVSKDLINVVRQPTWRTTATALTPEPIVHLRDPRFGWLHYALSVESARRLGQSLVKLADEASEFTSSAKQ